MDVTKLRLLLSEGAGMLMTIGDSVGKTITPGGAALARNMARRMLDAVKESNPYQPPQGDQPCSQD